ncbi:MULTISPECIES: cyclopropane-fatty-acyl-phospholipid synthase family protein [unclassified Roseateles]|uniref:SAM-dependent methyltransferase n=1 Tax=unclassified Roseateles TaxID=2626991 RepID=UPI0006F8BDC0|nr:MULTISPECIES: cyclopropane-fatty-acyl-phospholipid synthase family protein [unclassified Roseateles]KQW45766.1 cyclopropane-fatty-acyl-phospholipid synthase [Pelomonas sp. Root405]KRA72610.1 cyclopropane-fatty-acyl-phospholipid synthase [Pelomonas sp. Root662]
MTTTTSAPLLASTLPRHARRVLALLGHLQHGSLDLQTPEGELLHFGGGREPRAAIRIVDWQTCAAAMTSGDVGFAESFVDGHWTSPHLRALLELLIRNRTALESLVYGGFWGGLLHRLRHLMRRNTRTGSRKNIHAHYDLGNEFYKLWLDPTMNYSSAWFAGAPEGTLDAAQQAKMRRALAEAGVGPGSRVLEIGCGWGAVAEVAARDFDARLTGVTLSTEQLAWAQERLGKAGLSADLRLQDYRDIADKPFDAIVSIEMFEAVGREYWDGYFRTVAAKLKPGGRACIQSITIRDDLFDRYVRSTDFIQQYIFPGGLLPSPSQFRAHAAAAGLRVVNELAFGADYAETLRRWREAFLHHEGPVRKLGFDGRFMRLWEFYLAYCEAAFAAGNTDVMQFTLVRD